jgi:hypothetical protein
MNRQDAEILASSLSAEQRQAFRVVCGKEKECRGLPIEALVILTELGLVRRDHNMLGEREELVLLTQKGRKIVEFV